MTENTENAAGQNTDGAETQAQPALPDEALFQQQQADNDAEAAAATSEDTGANAVDSGTDDDVSNKDGDDGAANDEQGKAKAKPRRGVQKRIDQLTSEREEARREAEYWKGVAEGRKPIDGPDPAVNADGAQASDDAPPREQDFEEYADFVKAQAKYEARLVVQEQLEAARKVEAEREAEQKAAEAKAEADRLEKEFRGRVDAARDKYSDFDEVAFGSHTVTQEMADAIRRAENGPDIAYHLGSNPSEASRIAALDAVSQAIAIGQIGAELKLPQPKTQTSAPAPVSTVGDSGGGVPSPDKMTQAEYEEYRNHGRRAH